MKTKTRTKPKEIDVTNCICCKKQIQRFSNTQYCSSCKVHTLKLRAKIAMLKGQLRTLKIKIYGSSSGQQARPMERLRWNIWNNHNGKADCKGCTVFFSTKRLAFFKDGFYCGRCRKALSKKNLSRDLDRGGLLNQPSKIPRESKL